VKWDGVRALVAVEHRQVRLTSRTGNDVSASYPELHGLAGRLGAGPALLDGEVVAFAGGRTDFGLLQSRMHVGRPSATLLRTAPVTLLVFDVLHLGDRSLLGDSYDVRRAALEGLVADDVHWQTPTAFTADGPAVLTATRDQGMEGVVAKRRDSRYEPGRRSSCWVKVKHVRQTSAVVVGWKPGQSGRQGRVGSLLLALPAASGGGLGYAGHVGTGFSDATLRLLGDRLAPLERPTPPVGDVPAEHARSAVWVEPALVCDVEYTEWTRDGRLRHPSFKGLRNDLDPRQVRRE
jgi:bifunctional non-homologous end joining protein LigD